ncbi:YggS family pyridoxal phosphate-dependent enzyme [Sneathiella sp. P13V-1]|uniref:YggS family pyridoxal phosphate-dependent enzyme n=1 Tax=Sneathiella sp. P13V-1 TaxID=2697366 RepID=UPI00187B909F|nr:YggS family pyridoxal phosphate-dependent enzyme [Sneathiella sp. P13V-1]MBE7636096.1 YggS family pyridoxal phosphate-dependent enzyme [Sneathiella sp. P13V-1]
MTDIAANLEDVKSRIAKRAKNWGQDADKVTLVAVSKKQPVEKLQAALDAGHRVFGENRVQEAKEKWPALCDAYEGVELHLIGPLQTNKAKEAVALFDVIETVDRPKLARILSEEMKKQDRNLPVYIQINIGAEDQKAGIAIEDADDFISQCQNEYGLTVKGLMCIPPAGEQPSPFFAILAQIAERNGLEHLSMGMSGDYEYAVQFGATSVRVGTGIFGAREG